MTYDAIEKSEDQGKPIEVYTFSRSYLTWRYTSANQDVTLADVTYTATPIKRSAIEMTQELNRSNMRVTVPRDNEIAEMYRVAPPSDPINLTLAQYHEDDEDIAVVWMGRVITVEWSGSVATIILEPGYTSVRRTGLRRRYQKACPHVLYGNGCRVAKDDFRLDTTADDIEGATVLAPGATLLADGYYSGGFIEWEIESGVSDRRYIISHVGAELLLVGAPYSLVIGQDIKVFPGCDHTLATCDTKFSNAENYGGMPYIPEKNPFGSDPIF